MDINKFLSKLFGNKSTRDMKQIQPWVEKIKAAEPAIHALDNDALRAKTKEDMPVRESYIPFPIVFIGAGVKGEQIETPVTTDRIAPTLSRSVRIRAPNACAAVPLF